jgi:FKBP-type peptidyl-prolyl cis-trans isomerase FkpA
LRICLIFSYEAYRDMTEITRVPLQPIARGSLTKLWLGIAVVALLGAGVAYATMPPSVDVETIAKGSGDSPTRDDVVQINYKGMLPNGKVFDQGDKTVLALAEVVPGFTKAIVQMQRGGKYKVHIPSSLGYGEAGAGPIPPNTDLDFEIELLDFKSRAEVEQQQRIMQQLQQMQQMQGPGGAGAPAVPGDVAPESAAPQSVPQAQ